jgi:hypothetical protein
MAVPADTQSKLKTTHVALDNYDDIFSDFDISPYPKRLLSYDFLKELRRRSAETKTGELLVTFTLPKVLRAAKTEALIRKRLKDHFRLQLKKVDKKISEVRKKGATKVIVGLASSLAVFAIPLQLDMPLTTMVSVFSWYFMWSGFTDIFESSDKYASQRKFFGKFVNAKYEFCDEEDLISTICETPTPAKTGSS